MRVELEKKKISNSIGLGNQKLHWNPILIPVKSVARNDRPYLTLHFFSWLILIYVSPSRPLLPTISSPVLQWLRLNADAKVPNLQGITVDKIFGAFTGQMASGESSSSPSSSSQSSSNGKSYGVSRAANEYYAQTRSTVETRREVTALGELLVNDRDPVVAMVKKGIHCNKLRSFLGTWWFFWFT